MIIEDWEGEQEKEIFQRQQALEDEYQRNQQKKDSMTGNED